jgi:hypothetical protein
MSVSSAHSQPSVDPAGIGLRDILRTIAALAILPFGLIAYAVTGKTTPRTYQAFVWLFCATGGRSNDWLARLVRWRRPMAAPKRVCGVLGDLTPDSTARLVDTLQREGRIVFERALPSEVCDRLYAFACSTPATVRPMDGEVAHPFPRTVIFDGRHPEAVRYDYNTGVLLDNADVQELMADPTLLQIAQVYLGCDPVADVLSMWWHTNAHNQPDAEAAQFYHFDLDRIAWLKVFVYLTDVGPENGPHSFVLGSHQSRTIPWSMRRKGYARLGDDEVEAVFGRERCLEMTAPRGSIIIEDTRGLHKGNAVRGAPRLILQLQLSNSLFGGAYPPARISTVRSPALRKALAERPAVFRAYN